MNGVGDSQSGEQDITDAKLKRQGYELHDLGATSQGRQQVTGAEGAKETHEVAQNDREQHHHIGTRVEITVDDAAPERLAGRGGSSMQVAEDEGEAVILMEVKKAANWWDTHVAKIVTVEDDVRDYFALERTHLSYIRTSQALASLAVTLYQLFRLSSSKNTLVPSTRPVLALEKVVTIIMLVSAMLVSIVGCERFLIGQRRLEGTKWRAGGWELSGGLGGGFAVVSYTFIVALYTVAKGERRLVSNFALVIRNILAT